MNTIINHSPFHCLSGTVMHQLENQKIKGIDERKLVIGKNLFTTELNKENLTFDNNMNEIITYNLNKIGKFSRVSSQKLQRENQTNIIMNSPVKFLNYSNLYLTQTEINFRHFVLIENFLDNYIEIFDSYIPSNPVSTFQGTLLKEKNLFKEATFFKFSLNKNINVNNILEPMDRLYKKYLETADIVTPWEELYTFITEITFDEVKRLAFNLADSSVPASREVVALKKKEIQKSEIISNLMKNWQRLWTILRVSLYKYSITGKRNDLSNIFNIIKKLKIVDDKVFSELEI